MPKPSEGTAKGLAFWGGRAVLCLAGALAGWPAAMLGPCAGAGLGGRGGREARRESAPPAPLQVCEQPAAGPMPGQPRPACTSGDAHQCWVLSGRQDGGAPRAEQTTAVVGSRHPSGCQRETGSHRWRWPPPGNQLGVWGREGAPEPGTGRSTGLGSGAALCPTRAEQVLDVAGCGHGQLQRDPLLLTQGS